MSTADPIRKILCGMGICLISSIVALNSYIAAGWGVLDSAYMVIITLFGIGYGEVHPISDPILKIQTITLIIVGCLSGLYSVGGFIQLVAEGEIKRAFGAQRISRGIRKMKNHAIICGYGRVGKMLAADLAVQKVPFVVVDTSQERLAEAEEQGYLIVSGDATCDEVLKNAGIQKAKTLACVLPKDAINVFITLTARDLSPEIDIISRAESPSTERKLRRSGATHVIMPAAIGALRMSQIIQETNAGTQFDTQELQPVSTSLRAVPVTDEGELAQTTLQLAKETLRELGNVVGVQRGASEIMTNLHEASVLHSGDIVLLSVND